MIINFTNTAKAITRYLTNNFGFSLLIGLLIYLLIGLIYQLV